MTYFRLWFIDKLVSASLSSVGGMYATLYLPPWLAAMGMKVGKTVEVSTASNWTPDLCQLEDGSFLADNVCLGAPVFYGGMAKVAKTKVGKRSFIGNSAVIPCGTSVHNNCLLGVQSLAPGGQSGKKEHTSGSYAIEDHMSGLEVPDGTSWLGSPPMHLPARSCAMKQFKEKRTFRPSWKLYAQRYFIEFFRVTGPAIMDWGTLATQYVLAMKLDLPWWQLWLCWPLLHMCRGLCVCAVVWLAKWTLVGRYVRQEQPLWSSFVWRAEVLYRYPFG